MKALVVTASSTQIAAAKHLAHTLNLEYVPQIEAKNYPLCLFVTDDFIGLWRQEDKHPYFIDFLDKQINYRREKASLGKEMLAKAIGLKPRQQPVLVDATAGLGRDSFMLASLGFKVTALERSPYLFLLLKDALERAAKEAALAPVVSRVHLIPADAISWLNTATDVDIVYLDPMFPERKKTAAVKKEMRILQSLLPEEKDQEQLLHSALTCARFRVVVKRPRLANYLTKQSPSFCLTGQSSRFDVYVI